MARTFGGISTDRLNCAPHAQINNIANSGSGVTIGGTIRLTSLVDFQRICSKVSVAASDGFLINVTTDGATPGCLTVSFGSATTKYERRVTAANAFVSGENTIWSTTFISGTQPKIFRSAIDTLIAEASAYVDVSIGAGTPGADAALDLAYGNNGSSNRVINGDAGWLWIYAAQLTVAQLRRVQYGVLVHRQGIIEADATKQTRGADILKSIAGYRMLRYLKQDGTILEYSGNTFSNTLTGTTGATDTEVSNFDCPTAFEGDCEASNTLVTQEQTDYWYASSHARRRFTTTATSGKVFFWSSLSGFDAYSPIAIYEGDTVGAPHAELTRTAAGANSGTFSGLTAGSKTVIFQNSLRSRAGSGDVHLGSFIQVIFFNAAATAANLPAGSNKVLKLSSSTDEGFNATPTCQNSNWELLRNSLPSWLDEVVNVSFGGQRFKDIAFDATAIARTVALVVAVNPRALYINMMRGDWSLAEVGWTAAVYGTRLATLIADLKASAWTGWIYVADQAITADDGTLNGNGETQQAYRDAIASTLSGNGRTTYISRQPVLVIGDISGDNVHPTTAGQIKLYTNSTGPAFAVAPVAALTVVRAAFAQRELAATIVARPLAVTITQPS